MIIIEKNRAFFDEVARFNPKMAHLLETKYDWTDKLFYRSNDASLARSRRGQKDSQDVPTTPKNIEVVENHLGQEVEDH